MTTYGAEEASKEFGTHQKETVVLILGAITKEIMMSAQILEEG